MTAPTRRARARQRITSSIELGLAAVLVVAATVKRYGAGILDLAGAVCAAVFVAQYLAGGAWLVAAIWLLVTAYNLDRRSDRRPPS